MQQIFEPQPEKKENRQTEKMKNNEQKKMVQTNGRKRIKLRENKIPNSTVERKSTKIA